MEYGELLLKQGLIERPVTPYKICKFILNQVIETYKNKIAVVSQQQIIDEKTPVEKEQIQNEKKEVEETEIRKAYSGLRP